jgi:hypothetical protein
MGYPMEDGGTERTAHVRSLMDQAHAGRIAHEDHGRAAVNGGPDSGGDWPVPDIDTPAPLGEGDDSEDTDSSGPDRPDYQTRGQG